jgi:outer membrane protein insertion porin family
MVHRVAKPFGLLIAMCSLVSSVLYGAQLTQVPKRCSVPSVAESNTSGRKVIVEGINFDVPIHLPDSDVAQIIKEENQFKMSADGSGWIEDVEIRLRNAWMNNGYFRAKVTTEAHSVGGDSNLERFLLTAHVNEGLQYHLGDIRFAGDSGIPEAQLRDVFMLRGGELFSVDLVRKGMQALTRLYSSHGYVDFVAALNTVVDDNLQRISLVFQIQQGKQFLVGNVEILGLDSNLEGRLRSITRPGEFYNREAIYDFYKQNESLLPSGLLFDDGAQARRNVKAGIVDLIFDFRPCPWLKTN